MNCLALMNIYLKKEKNIKILLCACRKYSKNKKNGFLLVKLPKENKFFNNNKKDYKKNEYFFSTGKFEVYCFCQLLLVKNDFQITNDYTTNNIYDKNNIICTDFFLVGGFDPSIGQGVIKLYKLIYNKNEDKKIKIKFIQNIVVENKKKNKKEKKSYKIEDKSYIFKKFGGPISSIIQSDITGNIVVTCLDGNTYLFTPPNLSGLYEDNNIELEN